MKKIATLLFLFIFIGCTTNIFAQFDEKSKETARAGITATIVPDWGINPDYIYFGTLVSIDVPGKIVAYLKGRNSQGYNILINTTIPPVYNGFYNATRFATQSDINILSNFIDISGACLQSIINDWLNETETANLIDCEQHRSFSVGNQLNVNEILYRGNYTSGSFDITINYN